VESWADVLGVAKDSVQDFFEAALPNRPMEEVVCADICEAASGKIPLAARPPKAGVAGRHWPNHSRVFWDIDMSPSTLEAFPNEAKELERANHLLDPDGGHGGGASGNEMQERKSVEPLVQPLHVQQPVHIAAHLRCVPASASAALFFPTSGGALAEDADDQCEPADIWGNVGQFIAVGTATTDHRHLT